MVKKKVEIESKLLAELNHPERFTILPDGWIKDRFTGLEWGPSSKESMNLKDAEELCAELGGRLPTVHELQSIVDYTKDDPAINEEIFKDVQPYYHWSCTRTSWRKDCAWCVSFILGNVYNNYGHFGYYVRPVRVSQSDV